MCTIEITLYGRGRIEFQGVFSTERKVLAFAVVGGTGAFDGARGEASVKVISQKRTDLTITVQ